MKADSITATTGKPKAQSAVSRSISGSDRAGWSVFIAPLLLAALLLRPVVDSARASGDELTADWTATQECQGHKVWLLASPIPNGSVLNVQFYLRPGEQSPIGYRDVNLEVNDERGDKIPLKAPEGVDRGKWGTVSINSLGGGTACGFYEMTLKTGRHPSSACLTYRGEKCLFKFAVWRR